MANRWYRPKHQPLKVLNLFRKAWRDQKGTHDDPPSLLLSPILSPQHVQFVKLYNIENCCTILGKYSLLFVTKLKRISHFKFEFFLPSSNCLVPPFYPPKNIKVDPIIRIILVPPLSSVKISRDVVRENRGAWAPSVRNPSPLSPKWNDPFYRDIWRAASLSPGQPPPPHFEKADYAPANEITQNIIEFEHGHKRQLLSRSTIFMVYLLLHHL